MLPLTFVNKDEKVEIVESFYSSEKNRRYMIRIEEIGIRPGKEIVVINNNGKGPLLIKVGNCRLAIGRGLANKIMVRRV